MTPEERESRDSKIATLAKHEGWLAVRELIEQQALSRRIDTSKPDFDKFGTYLHGRIDGQMDILRMVDAALVKRQAAAKAVTSGPAI